MFAFSLGVLTRTRTTPGISRGATARSGDAADLSDREAIAGV
jgi:hypothetical protein